MANCKALVNKWPGSASRGIEEAEALQGFPPPSRDLSLKVEQMTSLKTNGDRHHEHVSDSGGLEATEGATTIGRGSMRGGAYAHRREWAEWKETRRVNSDR
ncbi:hypothetical protein ABEF95_001367 [Exophiala dermatitidis]